MHVMNIHPHDTEIRASANYYPPEGNLNAFVALHIRIGGEVEVAILNATEEQLRAIGRGVSNALELVAAHREEIRIESAEA